MLANSWPTLSVSVGQLSPASPSLPWETRAARLPVPALLSPDGPYPLAMRRKIDWWHWYIQLTLVGI